MLELTRSTSAIEPSSLIEQSITCNISGLNELGL
jgi:hypothetical protein